MTPDKITITLPTLTPFPAPAALGYHGNRPRVAFYWERCGDELAWFDGRSMACGMSDNYTFLDWLRKCGLTNLQIGDSDSEAINCILVDMEKMTVTLAPKEDTFRRLRDEFIAEQR